MQLVKDEGQPETSHVDPQKPFGIDQQVPRTLNMWWMGPAGTRQQLWVDVTMSRKHALTGLSSPNPNRQQCHIGL
jgi:hypothetical protein